MGFQPTWKPIVLSAAVGGEAEQDATALRMSAARGFSQLVTQSPMQIGVFPS
jgi:hypothetical protein